MRVAVIIPHYSKDKTFLNLCVDSLSGALGKDDKAIIVSSSEETPTGIQGDKLELIQKRERLHYAQAINAGINRAKEMGAQYVVMGNDDTIYTKESIDALVSTSKQLMHKSLVNPLSNCDNGMFYALPIKTDSGLNLIGSMKLDAVHNHIDSIKSLKGFLPGLFLTEALCFYCTLAPMKLVEEVGLLDEKFITAGWEDRDYCIRARRKGYNCAFDLNSFVFHFGGSSTAGIITDQERQSNFEYFKSKYS